MTKNDTATRRITTGIVLAVGLFAGADSYSHVYALARQHSQPVLSAALLPLAGDGLIAAATAVMLVASRQDREVPARARVMLVLGIGATIAANMAWGLSAGITGALLSVWPVACYVGCTELLAWMRQHTGMQPAVKPRPAPVDASPSASSAPSPDASAAPGACAPVASDELSRRRKSPAHDYLSAAEKLYPDAKNGGRIPPLREIQTALSIGQPKAMEVQRHFRTLQENTA